MQYFGFVLNASTTTTESNGILNFFIPSQIVIVQNTEIINIFEYKLPINLQMCFQIIAGGGLLDGSHFGFNTSGNAIANRLSFTVPI